MKWVALLLALGCGGSPSRAAIDLARFFEAEGIEDARREAPDLIVAAELARDEAEGAAAAGDAQAADDHATRARLLLDAALVELERIRLDRERRALLEEAEAASAEAEAHETERRALADRSRREAAAEIARAQMQSAYAAAERLEERGRRHRGADVDRTRREAAEALRTRTEILLAAARALGATAEDLATFGETGRQATDPASRLAAADARHRRALVLLGTRRAAHPVGPEVVASLVEAARERELTVTMTPEGLVLAEGSDAAILDVARAFPHGGVVVRGRGAAARARRLAAALGATRFEAVESTGPDEVLFTAYGAH